MSRNYVIAAQSLRIIDRYQKAIIDELNQLTQSKIVTNQNIDKKQISKIIKAFKSKLEAYEGNILYLYNYNYLNDFQLPISTLEKNIQTAKDTYNTSISLSYITSGVGILAASAISYLTIFGILPFFTIVSPLIITTNALVGLVGVGGVILYTSKSNKLKQNIDKSGVVKQILDLQYLIDKKNIYHKNNAVKLSLLNSREKHFLVSLKDTCNKIKNTKEIIKNTEKIISDITTIIPGIDDELQQLENKNQESINDIVNPVSENDAKSIFTLINEQLIERKIIKQELLDEYLIDKELIEKLIERTLITKDGICKEQVIQLQKELVHYVVKCNPVYFKIDSNDYNYFYDFKKSLDIISQKIQIVENSYNTSISLSYITSGVGMLAASAISYLTIFGILPFVAIVSPLIITTSALVGLVGVGGGILYTSKLNQFKQNIKENDIKNNIEKLNKVEGYLNKNKYSKNLLQISYSKTFDQDNTDSQDHSKISRYEKILLSITKAKENDIKQVLITLNLHDAGLKPGGSWVSERINDPTFNKTFEEKCQIMFVFALKMSQSTNYSMAQQINKISPEKSQMWEQVAKYLDMQLLIDCRSDKCFIKNAAELLAYEVYKHGENNLFKDYADD